MGKVVLEPGDLSISLERLLGEFEKDPSLPNWLGRVLRVGVYLQEKIEEDRKEKLSMWDMIRGLETQMGNLVESLNIQEKELRRLRGGQLSEEEFQNICHNYGPEDEERFKEGCRQTWAKLFPKRIPQDQVDWADGGDRQVNAVMGTFQAHVFQDGETVDLHSYNGLPMKDKEGKVIGVTVNARFSGNKVLVDVVGKF